MYMKLGRDQKERLLKAATQVYKGYVALDFFKTRAFQIKNDQLTLAQICENAIRSGQLKQTVTCGGQVFELELTQDSVHSYNVSFKRPLAVAGAAVRKPLNDYDDNDALALLSQQNFYLEVDQQAKLHVANKLSEKTTIGGMGKIDLYRSHLVTLNNIIEKISSEEDVSNLLVALATGSGKTYVQALWMLVLSLSGTNALFAVPDRLVSQLQNDLKRVLPNSLVDELFILRENDESSAVEEVLNDLKTPIKPPRIIISSSERLLDKHYQQLLEADPNRLFLSFDEQHLLMKSELRRVRLIELSKKMLSMFLTATPNQETYQLSGNKPVAIMSSGQKQAAGQGQFPVLFSENARNISDRNKLRDYRFWTSKFWLNMFRGILLRFSNSIQQEQSSAAVSIVESLPFYLHRKPGETDVRWSMQVPMARKMLCIIDDNETLVNFSHALEHSGEHSVYHKGNLVDRRAIANFFQLPEIDGAIVREDLDYRQEQYRKKLNPEEYAIGSDLVSKSLKEQIKDNIFHNMVEYVLTDLTGLDEIEHNRLRKLDSEGFQQLIREKFVVRGTKYYQEKLKKVIDPAGADKIANILHGISVQLGKMHDCAMPENFNRFVDNWALDDRIIVSMKNIDSGLRQNFEDYADSHLMIAVMTGMQASETPIEESRPFLGLHEDRYPMYDNGVLSNQAKRREHTSLETLNDTSMESTFTPNYQNFNEEICDNYFRLGFVGVYVSNKKTEGFSDRNLHTVINLAENKLSTTNSPDTLIQGIGRNRGLDDTIVPAYIHALGRGQETVFDLEHLKTDDYYPELFNSQKSYNQQFIKVLGKNVGAEIIHWFRNNVDKDETIDADKLKKQVLKIIAKSLRQLNNNNNHNIQLSRSQLTKVVGEAMNILGQEIARIKKPYKLTVSIKILAVILNFISEIYYSVKRIRPTLQRLRYSWSGRRSVLDEGAVSTKHPDDVYIKIINKTDFKTIVANISVAKEFQDWIFRKGAGIETTVRKNVEFYLKDELKDELNKYKEELVGPLFSKFVVTAKREMLLQAIKNMPNLIGFLEKNLDSLAAIQEGSDATVPEKVVQLLQQIPGLDTFTLKDVVNYPEQIKASLASFEKGPFALLDENQKLRHETITHLADYLRGPFLSLASAFFLDADLSRVKNVLQQENNAENFLHHLFAKTKDQTLQITDLKEVITEFKNFFRLEDFASLESRVIECKEILATEIEAIEKNPLANLKEDEITKIAKIIHEELLPCLVNSYPLAHRQAILNEVSLDKVKVLVKKEGLALKESMTGNEAEIAALVFSKLISTPLPQPLDIQSEASRVQKMLEQKFQAVLRTSKIELGAKKIFTPSSWKGTVDNPQYIYDVLVVDVLRSDDFINSISLMFSFNEWKNLKENIKNNPEGTLKLARALIDTQVNGGQNALEPETLIQLINQSYSTQYVGAQAMAISAFEKLEEQQKVLTEEPINALSAEVLAQFATIARTKLIPLLAAFIQDSIVRENFLKQISTDDRKIVQFIFSNKEKFALLQTDDVEQGKTIALEFINQLLPPEQQPLGIEQITHLTTNAEMKGEQLVEDLYENVLTSYLTSSHFSEFAESIFNSQDYSNLLEFLQNKEKVAKIAKKIAAISIGAITQDKLIALFQEDESLKDIQPLDKRLKLFGNFVEKLLNDGLESLSKNKLAGLAVESLAPVFFHPKFYASLQTLIGFLDEDDLAIMLHAMDKPQPKEQAATIMQFMKIIKMQDKKALQEKFMTVPEGSSEVSLDALPMKKTFELLGDLIKEVLDCQCCYNKHDNKGELTSEVTPKLYNNLLPELRTIFVEPSDSFFGYFSRKIFFIQAIRNGLPECAQVSADANQSQVKVFERINAHILRPLWWGTNMSNLGYAIVKMGRNTAFALRALGFAILNAFKTVLNPATVSIRNLVSEDYNDTAFDMAEKINELTPFDAPKVAATDCPSDVVSGLEASIAARRSPQFFASALAQKAGTAELADSPRCCM